MNQDQKVNAYIDISQFWLKPEAGQKPVTVHYVWEKWGKDLGLTRNTIAAAYRGELDRARVLNQVKLRSLCSLMAGRSVSLDEIVVERES